jgi:hypothetical protein
MTDVIKSAVSPKCALRSKRRDRSKEQLTDVALGTSVCLALRAA